MEAGEQLIQVCANLTSDFAEAAILHSQLNQNLSSLSQYINSTTAGVIGM